MPEYRRKLQALDFSGNEEFAVRTKQPWPAGPVYSMAVLIAFTSAAGVSDHSPSLNRNQRDLDGEHHEQSTVLSQTLSPASGETSRLEMVFDHLMEIFVATRGTRVIVRAGLDTGAFQTTAYHHLITTSTVANQFPLWSTSPTISQWYKTLRTQCLEELVGDGTVERSEADICAAAITCLEEVHDGAARLLEAKKERLWQSRRDNKSLRYDFVWLMKWTAMVSQEFVALLHERNTAALVVLAQFIATCESIEHQWYLEKWAKNAMDAVRHLLGSSNANANAWVDKIGVPTPISYPKAPVLEDSQNLTSVPFTGEAAECKPLSAPFIWLPEASSLHSDGGNSGGQDFPGPRGVKTRTSAKAQPAFVFLWGQDNQLTSGYINTTTLKYGLVALDPDSMDVLAAWYPEDDNQALNIPYMEYIVKTNDVLVSSAQGMIWVVHRDTCQGRPYFKTTRTVDLRPQLQEGDQLLNAMFDIEKNIWFTTGAVQLDTSANGTLANSTTYGYITPSNKVHKAQLDGETVENGIAVAGTDVYMVTSPSGKFNTPNAPGYTYSLTTKSGSEGGISTRWRVPYSAGERTELDPNTAISARGSGATPALIADKYVAITDNDTPRLHLNVYHQAPQAESSAQLLCQVPLFMDNKGSVQNSVLAHYDTQQKQSGIIILNSYGGPAFFTGQDGQDMNGKFNNMRGMAGGITRVDVDEHGNCSVRWTKDTKSKGVSVLSTNNGLVYHYVQDDQRAMTDEEYVWYLMGRSWVTGEEKFKVRAGSGGAFNDNWNSGALGPCGTFYQSVSGGIVAFKDGGDSSC
ncbi:hypothetical protein CMEL01_11201 [Colletotrichum melonis]|uniref:Uncharacterized protein n=1 Tax=Colletotrichum melonis TaxID=1209925 RepID=A0AAI9Y0T1_9PEZI|nr:hypothetical protein CMEL01_11201 [Colletotrichum melonis]